VKGRIFTANTLQRCKLKWLLQAQRMAYKFLDEFLIYILNEVLVVPVVLELYIDLAAAYSII